MLLDLSEPEKLVQKYLTLMPDYAKLTIVKHQGRITDIFTTSRLSKSATETTTIEIHVPQCEIEQAYEIEAMKECVSV